MACGRWIGELFPEIKKLTNPQKQVIAYLELEDMEKYQFGKMPSFGFNRTEIEYYCTPDRKGLGVKLGLLLNNAITPT